MRRSGEWPKVERYGRRAAAAEHIGSRPTMEDAHFLFDDFGGKAGAALAGVFDGHGGDSVSRGAAEIVPAVVLRKIGSGAEAGTAIRDALVEADAAHGREHEGSTAVVALLDDGSVTVANLGDSAALLVGPREAKLLTEDHRITNEAELARVKAAGASIEGPYVCKPGTEWGVMPTRGLGDHALRDVGIIAEAHVSTTAMAPDALWLVLGCDGLWDAVEPRRVAELARSVDEPALLCERLLREALEVGGSGDNVTVLAISMK